MNIKTDKILGASLVLTAFSFGGIPSALAQTCITPPTCASLGYKMTEAECEGHSFLKCPFDANIGYCDLGSGNKKSCSDGGYSSIKISGQNCTQINYEGLTCYSCAVAKTCSDGGYSSIKISGQNCTQVNYEGLTCYSCTVAKTCADGGYSQTQISGQNCKKVTYKGLTCYQCTEKSCADMGYNLNRPKGQGWNCTACPTDPSKYSCSEIPCPAFTYGPYVVCIPSNKFVSYSGDGVCCRP